MLNPAHIKPKGFTLIELLVVISIIAILSIVGLVVFTNVQQNARAAKRRGDIEAIAKAYESNFNGNYQKLSNNNFSSGTIPTPYAGGSYIVAGPDAINNPTPNNFGVCASLVDNNTCYSNSRSCYCQFSSQGTTAIDTFSLGNPVLNGSFETDSNGGGLADNWTILEG